MTNEIILKCYETAISRKMPAILQENGKGKKSLIFDYRFDTWLFREESRRYSLQHEDKLTEVQKLKRTTFYYPPSLDINRMLTFIIHISSGKTSTTNNGEQYIDDLVRRSWVCCQRYGFDMLYRFGNIYIKTKFDKWYFTPKRGKIRLMHRNTRYTSNNEYHVQFNKVTTIEDMLYYIHKHTQKLYMPQKHDMFKRLPAYSTEVGV